MPKTKYRPRKPAAPVLSSSATDTLTITTLNWSNCPDPIVQMVSEAFDRDALARICAMDESDFAEAFGLTTYTITNRSQPAPHDFFLFRDNGSNILAVAHLDTVAAANGPATPNSRTATFVDTATAGTVVYSRALDDRLGAYTILDLLPKLGINVDLLLTVGEEMGMSTAEFFDPQDIPELMSGHARKEYNWIIEFDRGGTDVVMYQYEDDATALLVEASGATVGTGIFSDIGVLDHLGVKAFNWGIGYRDYHGPRSHAFLDDTFDQVAQFVVFHDANADTYLPHVPKPEVKVNYLTGSLPTSGANYDAIFGTGGRFHAHGNDGYDTSDYGVGSWEPQGRAAVLEGTPDGLTNPYDDNYNGLTNPYNSYYDLKTGKSSYSPAWR